METTERKAITLGTIIAASMPDVDTSEIDARQHVIWDACVGTPFQKPLFDFDTLAGEKLCAYIEAAFLAGYKLGRNPGALVESVLAAAP